MIEEQPISLGPADISDTIVTGSREKLHEWPWLLFSVTVSYLTITNFKSQTSDGYLSSGPLFPGAQSSVWPRNEIDRGPSASASSIFHPHHAPTDQILRCLDDRDRVRMMDGYLSRSKTRVSVQLRTTSWARYDLDHLSYAWVHLTISPTHLHHHPLDYDPWWWVSLRDRIRIDRIQGKNQCTFMWASIDYIRGRECKARLVFCVWVECQDFQTSYQRSKI